MVKLRKIRTESPATTLGILSFSLDTGAPKISPRDFMIFVLLVIAVEIALTVFYSL